MASRGRGRRGRPRDTGQTPPTFDQPPVFNQQAFAEAVDAAAAAIAQASIAGSQGGPSNLQRFRVHHPPTFTGGGDPMVADHWFMQIENVLEAMEITSDTTRIRLAAFQLEGEARVWWRWARASRDLELRGHPTFYRAGPRGQSMGRGRGRGPQAETSGVQGCVYGVTPQAESVDQPVIQGTFLLSCLWARVLFDSGASHSFIAASVVIELGLEVETLEEPLYVSSYLGIRARIGMICRGCELEISRTLLTVDLRIMDMSEFDVILGMDWLTAYRVVIDCERRRVTAYTQDGTRVQGTKYR